MNQVMISADSTCDLPVDLQRQRHVYCFALSILLGDTAYYAADEDQLVQVLTELTQSQEKLEESRRQVFSLAGEKLDYMRQAEQILE